VPEPEARAVDDDAVLRALGEDLARDDPDLAARLSAGPGTPGRGVLWVVLLGALGTVAAPFLLGPAAFGVMALLVLIGCPFALCCWLPAAEWWPDEDPPS
jgi:Protein of unknown function (DUF3040)